MSTTPTSTISTSNSSTSPASSTRSSTPVGAIVGGVVGGLALLAGIVALVWYFARTPRTAHSNFQEQTDPNFGDQPIYSQAEKRNEDEVGSEHNNAVGGRLSEALVYPDTVPSGRTIT